LRFSVGRRCKILQRPDELLLRIDLVRGPEAGGGERLQRAALRAASRVALIADARSRRPLGRGGATRTGAPALRCPVGSTNRSGLLRTYAYGFHDCGSYADPTIGSALTNHPSVVL